MTPPQPSQAPASRVQRIVVYVGVAMLALGVVSIFALLIGESTTSIAVGNATGIWSIIALIPDIALPIGFVLLIVFIVMSFVRRSRAAEGAGK